MIITEAFTIGDKKKDKANVKYYAVSNRTQTEMAKSKPWSSKDIIGV